MIIRKIAFLLILVSTACATNRTTKYGQRKGKWVYNNPDGQIEREEYFKPYKGTIAEEMAFQLGWTQEKYTDSIIYGEELIRTKQYYYNDDGELQRIEEKDTSYLFLDLYQKATPYVNPKND